ncbi:M56 family metallopeptidase, partial [Oscillibacter sp.]|uniref:M56 family metallopeptidase n=1 Tax=Oscillibacter sp. TaxID=1945593 RepID=UPI002D7FC8DF
MTFLELSLSGAVFILAIAAFRAVTLRRLPKGTFVALWWLAAARLLLPVELASRFSVYTLLEALRPKAAPAAPAAPAVPMAPAAPPVLIVPTRPAAAPMPQPAPAPFPVWTALWLAVGLLLAAWFLIRYVRWRRRFREALPADCPGLETWFQLRRRVEVRVTDQIAAPLTYGVLRPVVLLPKTLDFADEEALT